MNAFERRVRAAVIHGLRDTATAPTAATIARALGACEAEVTAALRSLADQHRLVLLPGSDAVWMAHPFSAVPTDYIVRIGEQRWFANCLWDGLAILALLGDGVLDTRSAATRDPMRFEAGNGKVSGEGLVHFLVPARSFWVDIGFT